MLLLKNLSIKSKLVLISLIPLIALLYYLQINVRLELRNRQSAKQVISDVRAIEELSKLIHEIQKERGLTIAFLASAGKNLNTQLAEQREATDKIIASSVASLVNNGHPISGNINLDLLPSIRGRANGLEPAEVIDTFYYNLKNNLIDEVADISRNSGNIGLKNYLDDHLLILNTKDLLSQIRTELSGIFSKERIGEAEYGKFSSIVGKHQFNLDRLKKNASPELRDYFLKKYQNPFVEQTYAIIDSVYNKPYQQAANRDLDKWWSLASTSINVLKEVEDFSSSLIRNKAEGHLDTVQGNLARSWMIAVAVLILLAWITVSTVRNVSNSISRIKNAADRMAIGDSNQFVAVESKDELGDLAVSFNRMIASSKEFSEVADKIGAGDYTPTINVRSKQDTLGIALDKMKVNLEKLSKESEIRTWLLTGAGQLNDTIRGDKEIKHLASDIINFIAEYLKAQLGVIYLNENGNFYLAGSYAYEERKDNLSIVKPGQGLVGQSVLEKKPIVFTNVPDDYIRIGSGLGNSVPKNIVVFPFCFEGEVKGVIEIGSVQRFSELDLQFLKTVGENIAIAFNTAESKSKLKDLLEETQRQSEELQAQQEELRQSNEELYEKTELLEKSESELKTQQEELQQTNEELEEKANLLEAQKEKLENAKIDIESKARELEATSRYKSEFLANMSHELRTPLNSILILSQLLAENKSKSLGEKEIEFARNIYNSGADLLTLINEILDLSKVESGKMELDISEVAIEDIDSEITSMFSEVAHNKSIDFDIKYDKSRLKYISTDRQRLQQIIRNLLSNAFKFTAKGGKVTLGIYKSPPGIHFHNDKLKKISDIIAFSVKDTGIGIPQDKLGIVFEAFQQADGSTKRKYGGTGLGLSISRELANFLGGEIHVESVEGKGSTFTLYVPEKFDATLIKAAERSYEVKETRVDRVPRQKSVVENIDGEEFQVEDDRNAIEPGDKVVLIMEDDVEFAKVLLDFVRERKYKGVVATQGNTGLAYARHYKPDAILLDMKLPVMDGTEVLKHLKNDSHLRHVPVQIISGYDSRKESLELGAFDFIRKPVLKDDLKKAFDKIEDFVSRKLKKLLIVEDNDLQNSAIRELIGNGDVKSFSAFSGEEGYRMMCEENFDCVIIDLGLPDMSGFGLMEKIKADERLSKVPIIVYTGRDLSKEEHARLTRLANTVVLKTANSQERLLDETTLFLHRVESRLPKEKQNIIRKLHKSDEVLIGKKVLIVDDDIRNIYSLTNVLEEEGMTCLTAENGKIALKMLKEDPSIEIVLMDIMMPEMDGYEATKRIRSIERFSKLPIIALTAKAMKGDKEKCLSAGMSDYISKPVNIEQLLSLMRVWLYR